MKWAHDVVRGIIHKVTINDQNEFRKNVFGGGSVLKKLEKMIATDSVYVNVNIEEGYYYFLNENGRIFHHTMFICREELNYITLGEQREIKCVNELSDVYISELIQGDSILNDDFIYKVIIIDDSHITFKTVDGIEKYQFGTNELKTFCESITGLNYDNLNE